MKKFIVSDLHGNGEVYNSIMAYLENVSLEEEVELYINGDLIDRGLDSFVMLMDVYERINGKGNIKIHYLGGNHELMMWNALKERAPGKCVRPFCNWMCNGGWVIEGELDSRDDGEELCDLFLGFLGNLKIYHNFFETVNDNRILLVHAQAPKNISDTCRIKISDDTDTVFNAVWTRKENGNHLGKKGYLTIIGHTPVNDKKGFIYDKEENLFNIDGGCASFANGVFRYDLVPVIEVCDELIKILVFNHNNEIVDGYIFDGNLYNMGMLELYKNRKKLNHKYDNCLEEKKKLIRKIQEII